MDLTENLPSDSDESDEDFCPDAIDTKNNSCSEDESSTTDSNHSDTEEVNKSRKTKKVHKKAGRVRKKKLEADANNKAHKTNEKVIDERRTRNRSNGKNTGGIEKDTLDSDSEVENKSHVDALWADFLSDVKEPSRETKTKNSTQGNEVTKTEYSKKTKQVQEQEEVPDKPKTVVVEEIFDFAGEEVRVQKVVSAESIKENETKAPSEIKTPKTGIKRTASLATGSGVSSAGKGGLGAVLNQLGKKKKISVLEKTKLDWNGFKQDEGIEEELQTFNKGKDGYMARQDFLQRTDLRQFEIEKNLRQTQRKY